MFQAGPSGIPPGMVGDDPYDFHPIVDGIPWMGWDLGGHHREKREDYYYTNDVCPHMIDQEAGCYFDGGTASGAMDLLAEWANRQNCSDEFLFNYLEQHYASWMQQEE